MNPDPISAGRSEDRTPAISVVMTVFNGERFVGEAIQSILDQTYTDFEFVIVDNHSVDSTCAIVESFQDSRIRFIKNERNLGQTTALNIGIRNSRAALIARMDADDVADKHRFERQFAYLADHPEIDVLGSSARFRYENGRYLHSYKVPCDPTNVTLFMSGSPELSYGCTLHPTLMVRRSAFDQCGQYDEVNGAGPGYPQDYELWNRMTYGGMKFANLEESLLVYRVLRTSESRSNEERLARYRLQITADKIRMYCPGLTDQENRSLSYMLEFRRQASASEGQKVLQLFDRYFEAYVDHTGVPAGTDKVKCMMKMYYLPVLFRTNAGLSIATYFRLVRRYPMLVLNIKFYRKLAKTVLSALSLR